VAGQPGLDSALMVRLHMIGSKGNTSGCSTGNEGSDISIGCSKDLQKSLAKERII
jgi:hypothetical protein